MIDEFLKYSDQNRLFKTGDKILLAVSGGIDSMVMMHLFLSTMKNIAVAHCNFCLRGKDADLDQELVEQFSAENSVPCYSKRFGTMEYAAEKHISVQMAARDLRYEWFEEIRRANGFDRVAVAHNLNDNIETLLINLTRGTGITGLAGMKPASNSIIRPLLFATRGMIANYAITFRVPYREDKTNVETKYIRNKIRHSIIPLLKEINPSVESTLNETALRMAGADEIVNQFTDNIRNKLVKRNIGYLTVNISDLDKWLHNQTLIYELFRVYGITGSQVKDLYAVIKGATGSRIITDGFMIIRNREDLIIKEIAENENLSSFKAGEISELPGTWHIESAEIQEISKDFTIPHDPLTGCFDNDRITWPVIIRKWKPGDSFYPLGMDHRKKISDYLTDTKCPLPEKENTYVMESEGIIFWLAGKRIDNRFRITGSTKRALIIRLKSF